MHVPHIGEKSIREVFIGSLWLKGLGSVLETLGGVIFLFTGKITALLTSLSQAELIEDPHDFVGNQIQNITPYLSAHGQSYAAFYFLSHGIIKTFLIIALLRNKFWAYPATLSVLSFFVVYQLYRLVYGYSLYLILLSIFDAFLIFLTWHEYNLIKKHVVIKP